jgi:hypothetical protein
MELRSAGPTPSFIRSFSLSPAKAVKAVVDEHPVAEPQRVSLSASVETDHRARERTCFRQAGIQAEQADNDRLRRS